MPYPSRLSVLAALPLVLLLACHKVDWSEPEADPVPAKLKAYTLFQPGSYWIYRDSASRQLDSVWVVSTEMRVVRFGGASEPVDQKHEDFRLRTRSSQGGVDLVYSVDQRCPLNAGEEPSPLGPCWFIVQRPYDSLTVAEGGGYEVFPYAIKRDQATFFYVSFAAMSSYWHSQPQTIGGQTYEGVLEVKLTYSSAQLGEPTHSYWAPGQGIVQQRVRRRGIPYTRTLVRSKIVQ